MIEMTSTKNTIVENGVSPTLTARTGTGENQVNAVFTMQAIGAYKESEQESTLKQRDYKDATDLVCSADCRNLTEKPELYQTLQAKPNGGQSLNFSGALRDGNSVRRLTPVECERLQGYPEDWTKYGHDGKEISDSARYKACGNSLALPCVEYLISGIAVIESTESA